MTKLSEITKIRDEQASNWQNVGCINGQLIINNSRTRWAVEDFKAGFDAATSIFTEREKLLMSVIEKMKETINKSFSFLNCSPQCRTNDNDWMKCSCGAEKHEKLLKQNLEEVSKMMEGLND